MKNLLSIVNCQCSVSSLGGLQTTWWLADWSPVKAPVDVWLWDGDSLAGQRERGSTWHLQVRLWWVDDGWLDASDLIGSIVTIVGSVAVERGWDTLATIVALEFSRFAAGGTGLGI